jgi:hypothetical protein
MKIQQNTLLISVLDDLENRNFHTLNGLIEWALTGESVHPLISADEWEQIYQTAIDVYVATIAENHKKRNAR